MTMIVSSQYSEQFIHYVITQLISEIYQTFQQKKDEQKQIIQQELLLDYLIDTPLDDIVEFALENVSYDTFSNYYTIHISYTKKLPNTKFLINNIVKIIDKGTLSIKGLHIFDTSFKRVQNNLDLMYQIYKLQGGE